MKFCTFFVVSGEFTDHIANAISGALTKSIILKDIQLLSTITVKVALACSKQEVFLIMTGKEGDIYDAAKTYKNLGVRTVIVHPYKSIKGKDTIGYEIQGKVKEADLIVEKVFQWMKDNKVAKPLI